MEKLLKVLTDSVSNQILQLIRQREKMTISQILAECSQIPRATVYRKIEKMVEVGAIEIVDSHKVRGQTENVYAVKKMFITTPNSNEESMKLVTMSLMQIVDQYDRYFKSGNADVNRDKLFIYNYAIPLNDRDFSAMMNDVFKVVNKYSKRKVTDDAKLRNLYLLSVPKGENDE